MEVQADDRRRKGRPRQGLHQLQLHTLARGEQQYVHSNPLDSKTTSPRRRSTPVVLKPSSITGTVCLQAHQARREFTEVFDFPCAAVSGQPDPCGGNERPVTIAPRTQVYLCVAELVIGRSGSGAQLEEADIAPVENH